MGKRRKLTNLAARCGLTALLECLPRRACLIVLNYHRIGNPPECLYDRGVIEATPEQFDQQLSWLKRRFAVASLEESQALVEQPSGLRHSHLLITFDDGYLDNYEVAFPILRSHGLPAAFFLPTSFIGTDRLPWWDRIAWILRQSRRHEILLEYPQKLNLELGEGIARETAILRILKLYKSPAVTDQPRFLADLERACDAALPQTAHQRVFMNWDEAATMLRSGMGFGSHTHSHELLAKQSAEQQEEELLRSREILRSRLSIPADALAYPVGGRNSFSDITRQILAKTGYRTAFSYYGGVNLAGNVDPLNILRMQVDLSMSLGAFRLQALTAAVLGYPLPL
jgi:peptidoglycan/xylan/chitin deacetylase (PgdA/CDA1 family)